MDRLAPYAAKRDPAKTPEPFEPGTPSGGALRYSMQNHDATRLHWDLRLEWEGVLLSWAVTRGPSLDPADKRLAVRTEDHPLPYLTFEGTIPKGEYGAGTVMLWDIGHWRPVEDAARGLTKGHLRFQLYGRRLSGLWDLVRIKGKPADKGRENWLMVKVEDAAAHQPDPVARYTTSIASGRDFAAIAAGAKAVPPGPAEPLAMPKPAEPMLAKLVTDPPEGDDWLHEVKIDGYRGLVHLGRGGPVIRTRNGLDWTDRFAPLVPVLASLPARAALIDGEIVAGAGAQGFAALQQAITDGGPFGYVAFDLLELDGASLRREPLTARRAALAALLGEQPPLGILQMSVALPGDGAAALGAICAAGGEGIVSKRAASVYRAGRSDSWRKIKCDRRTAFAVIGWAKSDSPGRPFASLLLASPEGDGWRYRGRVGTGFSGEVQADLAARMAPLTRKTAPAAVPRSETRGVTWVEPALMAEVRYAEETTGGILRHASFQGLREDKMAPPAPPEPPVVRVERVTAGRKVAGVTITNPDRVIFPEPGVTKGELAEYYAAAAPLMLAHCANRPLSLVRLPEGMGGQSFFQKHAGKGFPAQIAQTDLPGEDEPALYVTSAAGLVGAVVVSVVAGAGVSGVVAVAAGVSAGVVAVGVVVSVLVVSVVVAAGVSVVVVVVSVAAGVLAVPAGASVVVVVVVAASVTGLVSAAVSAVAAGVVAAVVAGVSAGVVAVCAQTPAGTVLPISAASSATLVFSAIICPFVETMPACPLSRAAALVRAGPTRGLHLSVAGMRSGADEKRAAHPAAPSILLPAGLAGHHWGGS